MMLVLLIPVTFGCANNKPSFPLQEDLENSTSSDTSYSNYIKITIDENVSIKSSSLTANDNGTFSAKIGSFAKIDINLPIYKSTTDEIFYFNETTNSIVSGVKINNQTFSLSDLNDYFIITDDTNISLIQSPLSLSSIMFCQKYTTDESDTLYKKFNYKSSNFRNSLIKINEDLVTIDNSVKFVTFENLETSPTKIANVSNQTEFNFETKTINIKVETFYETTEVSLVFAYKDEHNNLFLSNVNQTSLTTKADSSETTANFKILGNTFNNINIKFAKYYLKNAN